MIALFRIIAVAVFAVVMFIFGCGYCLLSPRNPKNVFKVGSLFNKMTPIFGIKLELRIPEDAYSRGQHIYVANHQNNWDLFTVSSAVTPKVVTVGKKSIAWMPLFGPLYWLSGNILIDRANRSKAVGTIDQVINKLKSSDVSVWMFPEGTRSRGRGLLPFKTGAFHAAIGAQLPVIPIVCSSTDGIKLNRWNNGHVIVEMLAPISTEGFVKGDVRKLAEVCRNEMASKFDALNDEVTLRNKAEGVKAKA
ncbi:1-acylglycerol-3-phosphate O-acyltransferase [Vibrio sp. FNV 38]|nr:1-acylglycerol-3-phosphate O-acyltransferase [Vibrio sp. FNV 38]